MNLTDKQIQNFIDAWKADFGESLSPEMGRAEAVRLLDFFFQLEDGARSQRALAKKIEDSSLREAWKKTMRR